MQGRPTMNRRTALIAALVLVISACGGGDSGEASDGADSDGSSGNAAGGSGEVVDQQPAGQAVASVDGEEFTFDTPGLADCSAAPDTFTFSFVIGDNEVGLAGGANLYDDGWLGSITLRVVREDGPYQYFPPEGGLDDGIAISGDSVSYSGPMLMRPPNDGSNPPDQDVGDGTVSVTCG